MIAILDYDAGNIRSVEKAFQYLGEETVLSRDRDEILSADKVVLPGVGAFGDAMNKLKDYNLVNTIYDVVDKGYSYYLKVVMKHRESVAWEFYREIF